MGAESAVTLALLVGTGVIALAALPRRRHVDAIGSFWRWHADDRPSGLQEDDDLRWSWGAESLGHVETHEPAASPEPVGPAATVVPVATVVPGEPADPCEVETIDLPVVEALTRHVSVGTGRR